jgi:hypothetical protein
MNKDLHFFVGLANAFVLALGVWALLYALYLLLT